MIIAISRRIFWVIALLLSCRSFELVNPDFTYRMEGVWIYVLAAIFLGGLLRGNKMVSSKTGAYVAFIMFYFPAIVAIITYIKWGQPLIYGVAIMRRFFLLMFVLLLDQKFRQKRLTLEDVGKIMNLAAWTQLVLFLSGLFLNQEVVMGGSLLKGEVVRGQTFFLVYGFFYYAWVSLEKTTLKKKYLHMFLSLIFLSVMVFLYKGRGLFFSTVLAWGIIFLFRKISMVKKSVWIVLSVFFLVFLAGILLPSFHREILMRAEQFMAASSEAFKVVLTGQESADASANLRLQQVAYVRQNTTNWLFGEGYIHSNWNGFKGYIPTYFFPTDIGWFGIIYLHGWVGLLILLWQFLLARRYSCAWQGSDHKIFFLTCQTMCLFCFLNSFATGMMSQFPANALVFVLVMQEIVKEQHRQSIGENNIAVSLE